MRMMKAALAASILSGIAVPAFAQNAYVLLSGGRSDIRADKGKFDDFLVSEGATPPISSSLDTHDNAYKAQVGYQFNPYFAVEGGYVDLGKAKYSASYTGGSASGDVKVKGWNVDAVGVYPLESGFALFGKLGLIDAKVETSGAHSASNTRWRPNYGVGASYAFTPNWGARLEWERFDKVGKADSTTEFNADLLSVGVSYRF